MKSIFSIIIFLSLPFGAVIAQNVLETSPAEKLKINTTNLKPVFYRGEKVFVFENHVNTNTGMLISPDSLPNGKFVAFYNNDTSKLAFEISYSNRKKNGKKVSYFNNGKPSLKENYKDGKLEGKSIQYNENGKVYEEVNYNQMGQCDKAIRYENDGVVKTEYLKDKTIVKKYNLNSKLIQEEIWKGKEIVEMKKYDSKGNLIKE